MTPFQWSVLALGSSLIIAGGIVGAAFVSRDDSSSVASANIAGTAPPSTVDQTETGQTPIPSLSPTSTSTPTVQPTPTSPLATATTSNPPTQVPPSATATAPPDTPQYTPEEAAGAVRFLVLPSGMLVDECSRTTGNRNYNRGQLVAEYEGDSFWMVTLLVTYIPTGPLRVRFNEQTGTFVPLAIPSDC